MAFQQHKLNICSIAGDGMKPASHSSIPHAAAVLSPCWRRRRMHQTVSCRVCAFQKHHSAGYKPHKQTRPVLRCSAASFEPQSAPAAQPETAIDTQKTWTWRGHSIRYAVQGSNDKPKVLFVHGFGASIGHWRKNIPALAEHYQVWAIDLLGQGGSAKPVLDYSMELWQQQLQDFIAEVIDAPVVLVGNSVGSLACLMVAAADDADRVAGLVLVNCAGGMNNKAITDDWRIKLALPIFWLIDFLLSKPKVARYLFDRFRTKDNLRQVLQNVYTDKSAVDDALVDLLYGPSCDVGALEAFVSIITGPPGPTPASLIPSLSAPLLVFWGSADVFTPLDGPVGKYFQTLPKSRPDTEFRLLSGENHCVHDDNPSLLNSQLLSWLRLRH